MKVANMYCTSEQSNLVYCSTAGAQYNEVQQGSEELSAALYSVQYTVYSSVQCRTVQYCTVQYIAALYSAEQCRTVQCRTVQHCTVKNSAAL